MSLVVGAAGSERTPHDSNEPLTYASPPRSLGAFGSHAWVFLVVLGKTSGSPWRLKPHPRDQPTNASAAIGSVRR